MNKKLVISLILMICLSTARSCVYAAETLDVPQETYVEQTNVQTEDKELKKEDTEKKETQISDNEIKESEETAEKPEKSKKFFTKAQKEEKTEKAHKNKKSDSTADEPTTDVLVDSDTIEYFPERHEFEATGNAKVTFPSENSVLIADKITFNHDTNYVKGYGNVVLIKEGQKINGEYIQVDLNENNAMMTHPVLNHMAIKIRAKQGIVYDAKTEALDGKVTFNDKASYQFMSRPIFGFDKPMMEDAIPKNFYFKEHYDNRWSLKAKTIVIDSYKDRDIATLKNADIYLKDAKIASAGKIRLYTDKEQKYIETNLLELGSLRNFGAFVSPGVVLQTPNASTFKIGPALTYKGDIGVGALGRFMTDKNRTDIGWSSSKSKFIVRGEQEFTDNLKLEYGVNQYLNNYFLGGRMPKYGLQFIHHKDYQIDDLDVTFSNRFVGGYYKDWNSDFSTTKFAWQTMTGKSLFKYKNLERKFALDAGINVQTHAAVYGTGDTMGLLRAGPYVRTQYKWWQQYVGYFQGAQAGNTPFYFDQNFYGKSSVQLGESLRICKYLTLMYSAMIVLSNDTPNGDMLQENRFYALIGPDDLKFMIGYDAYRQNATMGIAMNIGAENADVEFKRLILNEPDSLGQKKKSDREKAAAQKKKAEEKKKKELDPMNRSVKEYDDYNPGFNMMPGGTMLQPSLIRPQGMY